MRKSARKPPSLPVVTHVQMTGAFVTMIERGLPCCAHLQGCSGHSVLDSTWFVQSSCGFPSAFWRNHKRKCTVTTEIKAAITTKYTYRRICFCRSFPKAWTKRHLFQLHFVCLRCESRTGGWSLQCRGNLRPPGAPANFRSPHPSS